MISGTYTHTLDAKNRTFLPAKLRDALGETLMLTRGLDKCLAVYPMESWKKFEAAIQALPPIKARQVRRWIYGYAMEVTVDSQGRIGIPPSYKAYAELEKNIVSVGLGDHIEIWSDTEHEIEFSALNGDSIAATLIEMGM